MNSDYSSSDEDNGKGITIKGAAQYMSYKPQDKKNKANNNFIEEYYRNIQRWGPELEKANMLKQKIDRHNIEFKQKYKNNNNAFLNE